jgi:hypothetical protein
MCLTLEDSSLMYLISEDRVLLRSHFVLRMRYTVLLLHTVKYIHYTNPLNNSFTKLKLI